MSADLSAMSGFAQAAYVEAMAAAAIIPAAWPIVAIIYEAQSDPQQIWDAADGWKETIAELEKAQAKIEELSRRLGEDEWTGDDRDAFEARMHDYVNQFDFAIVMAWAVTVTLYVIAIMIAVFITVMFVIASILAIFAAAICIAAGTVFGAPAALQMEAEANAFALQCLKVLEVMEKGLTFTFWGASATLGGFLTANMTGQFFKGNKDAFVNLAQATMNGADVMLAGTLQYLEQKGTSKALKGKENTILGKDTILGKNISDIPAGALPFVRTIGGGKGTIDVFTGGPSLSGSLPLPGDKQGTEDEDKNGRPDGVDFVDRTQPRR